MLRRCPQSVYLLHANFGVIPPYGYHIAVHGLNYTIFLCVRIRQILKGVILVLIIEIIEPVFGRAFDVNDIFLNTLGVLVSSTIYVVGKYIVKKCSEKQRI